MKTSATHERVDRLSLERPILDLSRTASSHNSQLRERSCYALEAARRFHTASSEERTFNSGVSAMAWDPNRIRVACAMIRVLEHLDLDHWAASAVDHFSSCTLAIAVIFVSVCPTGGFLPLSGLDLHLRRLGLSGAQRFG